MYHRNAHQDLSPDLLQVPEICRNFAGYNRSLIRKRLVWGAYVIRRSRWTEWLWLHLGVEQDMGEGHCDLLGVEQEEGGGIKTLSFPAVKSSMISRDIDDRDTDWREYLHVESFFRDCSFVRNTNLKEGALSTIDLYGRINLEGSDLMDKKKAGVITWLSYWFHSVAHTGRSKTMFLAWLDVDTGYQLGTLAWMLLYAILLSRHLSASKWKR